MGKSGNECNYVSERHAVRVAWRGRMAREAGLLMCGPQGRAGVGGAVKGEALCARAAAAARPWTARSPAPGSGHTHEEHGHAAFNSNATVDKAILCFA